MRGDVIMEIFAYIIPLAIIGLWGLGIYALILLIKALKIYIDEHF